MIMGMTMGTITVTATRTRDATLASSIGCA